MNQKITIWLNIHNQSGSTTATTTFVASNETFSVFQTLPVSSSKVEDIEEESPKRKEYFWESYYWCNIYLVVLIFGEMLYPNVWLQFISSLWKTWKKQGLLSLLYLKYSTSSCRYICGSFASVKVNSGFEIDQQIVYTMRSLGHGYAELKNLIL